MRGRVLAAAYLLIFTLGAPADELADKIKALTHSPDYKQSRWGILVVENDSGNVVYAHNPDMFCVPASVTKLYSCAAALVAIGPDHRFETPVYSRGTVLGGTLHGDLILVGAGDLTFGGRAGPNGKLEYQNIDHIYANWLSGKASLVSADPLAGLNELARQVKESGIRRVDGDVLIDERLFQRTRGSGSGPDLLCPLVVNDNVIDVTLTPAAKAGEPATVELRPKTAFIQIDAQVETRRTDKPAAIHIERVGSQRYAIRGSVALGGAPTVRICPVDEPSGFVRALFIEALRRAGVRVLGSELQPPMGDLPEPDGYSRLTRVAVHKSEPFGEVIKVTLKVSHNLYASTLPVLLAAHKGKRTLAEGMKEQGRVLAELGLDVNTISLESGAGGGNGDRVTPRTTVDLLRAMTKRPEYAVYKDGLPILGVDGTLADSVGPDSPVKGKVFAKTGTYGDADLLNERLLLRSKALAGYMTTARGKHLTLALFLNDVALPRGADPTREGKLLGKICEVIYQHAP